jgi:uncharacterized protein YndB with AHSA1/START domain
VTSSILRPPGAGLETVVLERAFTAPRELVFRVFTDPEHLVRWWFPYSLTFAVCEWDARPGGAIYLEMATPDGTRFPFVGSFLEVDPPCRVVFVTRQNAETEVVNSITFTERGSQTVVRVELKVTKSGPSTAETLAGTTVGWMQDFGRLAFYLLPWTDQGGEIAPEVTTPSDREIVVTRTYRASRTDIFEALSDSERTDTASVLIVPPELIVTESAAGRNRLDAVHLFERDGITRLTSISLFATREERDRALADGFAGKTIERHARLVELLPARV